ncbi:MAG: hypothetical protein AAGJ56_10790, partial [Myxococcota bacterium]
LREFKETIDSQLQHSLAVIYTLALWPNEFSFTAEVQNLTNERLFDFFGVERPGRAFFFKTTAELRGLATRFFLLTIKKNRLSFSSR